jgi:hypothetical protein
VELENYFDFINEEAIRIKGTRVGIETVVRDYLHGASPEEIVLHYPTLTLERFTPRLPITWPIKIRWQPMWPKCGNVKKKPGWSNNSIPPNLCARCANA